jgi:hypothetical protein
VNPIAARTPDRTQTRVRTRDPERRSRILAAAADLVARKGFHAVSVAEIGAAAGITGSGIYRHFDRKTAVLAPKPRSALSTTLSKSMGAMAFPPNTDWSRNGVWPGCCESHQLAGR